MQTLKVGDRVTDGKRTGILAHVGKLIVAIRFDGDKRKITARWLKNIKRA